MHSIIRSEQADRDLYSIWRFIAEDSVSAADRHIDLFHERFSLLSRNPHLGATCSELESDLRFLVVGNYVVYYSVGNDSIAIARVLHGARDVTSIFRHR
jgi:toxin ParE1/3/4